MELRCNIEETTGELLRLIRNTNLVNNPDHLVLTLLGFRESFTLELTSRLMAAGLLQASLDPRRIKPYDYGLPNIASMDQKAQITLRSIYTTFCASNNLKLRESPTLLSLTISILGQINSQLWRQSMEFNTKLSELLWTAWLGYITPNNDTSEMHEVYQSAHATYVDPRRIRPGSKIRKLL